MTRIRVSAAGSAMRSWRARVPRIASESGVGYAARASASICACNRSWAVCVSGAASVCSGIVSHRVPEAVSSPRTLSDPSASFHYTINIDARGGGDEAAIRRFVRLALGAEGHTVHEADSVARGLIEAGTRRPDLVVLDLGLPDGDGIEVIRGLRSWSTVPVIVLSARSQEADKIAALDAGADDYLVKPFGAGELNGSFVDLLADGVPTVELAGSLELAPYEVRYLLRA